MHADHLVVCTRTSTVYVMTTEGQVVQSLSSGRREGGDFVGAVVAPRGGYIYCLGEDGNLYCFNVKDSRLEHLMQVHEKGPIGLAHHPHRNLLATYADEAEFKLWRAS